MADALTLQAASALVRSITTQHAALGLASNADVAAQPEDDTPRAVAYAAARRLGFIDADARCIAQAWQRQADRTGIFDTAEWPERAADFGIDTTASAAAFPGCPMALGVYAVLPDAAWVARLARAGVPTLQLRFKSPDPQAVQREVQAAVQAVQGSHSLLFINDHWREAIAAGAYGVHLGQEDLDALSADELATLRASGVRLGLSTHGYAEMLRAEAVRPSYIAMGAVYPTTLKAMPTPPQGPARLRRYARVLRHRPLVAIGGIGLEQIDAIAASGVGSFAVVRAVTAASKPEAAYAELQQRFEQARQAQARRQDALETTL